MRLLGITLLSVSSTLCAAAACPDPPKYPANCNTNAQLFQILKTSLSPKSLLYLPGSNGFSNVTTRWSELDAPTPNIVVVPATEDDVAHTVQQANKCGVPILAFNGVHGASTTLGRMNSGVAISLNKLSSVKVAKDGKTATIGGGTLSKTVTDTLWAAGKQTVTGTCECVSYLGPALGGGHGWLQGHHGLVADQSVSMNVVLADGTRHTITPSSDLWWAMKGAGQNFGIVTSVTSKVYPVTQSKWAVNTLMFTGDKVEAVYQAANKYLSNLPANVINWSYWLNIAELDPKNPIIIFYIIQEGVTVVDPAYTAPFQAIGPISSVPQSGTYTDLAAWTEISLDSPPCQKAGLANPRFPIYLRQYDVAAQVEAYAAFAAAAGVNTIFNTSIFMFEAYPQEGVRAVDAKSTAFAFRDDNLLVSPLITYTPNGKALDAQAEALGNKLRNIMYKSSNRTELHAYVNYAYGNEQPQNWYGYESWRQDRLKGLKKKYDPKSQFSFFGPVVA
ncbi:putative FAD-dependent oxygenase [Nemania sp. FL0916]|nr:putative FAD-dependent oxygenase [Nemania sp. FL0916]